MIKKVLVLAGAFDQIALINELKAHGLFVMLADYFENPPAKKYADKHYQVSTLDENAIYNLAVIEKIDLITTACTDQALLTAARVSERLGISMYISAETAINVTNKAYMKKCFFENKIPTAKSVLFEDKNSIRLKLQSLPDYPLVVKPCDCNSSKGVIKVKDEIELIAAAENAFDLSRSKKVIVEQYIEGREVSIDVWVDPEGAKVLSVSETEKIPNLDDSFTICQSKYPVDDICMYKDKIEAVSNDIAMAFQLTDCPMLIQALLKDGDIYVIEISARMGGGSKYKLIEYMSGVNIMKVYVNRVMGITNQIVKPRWSDKYMELDYLYSENGTLTDLRGIDELLSNGIIDEYFQYKPIGSEITSKKTSSDRIVGILLTAESLFELKDKRKQAFETIDIMDDKTSILFKGCFDVID